MALKSRRAAPIQRLVASGSRRVEVPMLMESVGSPVEFLLASRESLQHGKDIGNDWATTAVYVLIGGPEVPFGPGDPVAAYDDLLGREPSEEPPDDPDATEQIEAQEHTRHWRARFYTGLTRDAVRRMGEHSAKPWWNRALLCRQAPPWPYEIGDIGFLEGELHTILDSAYWLRREGRASKEDALLSNRERALKQGHLPVITTAIRLMGVPLDTAEHVERMLGVVPSREMPDA